MTILSFYSYFINLIIFGLLTGSAQVATKHTINDDSARGPPAKKTKLDNAAVTSTNSAAIRTSESQPVNNDGLSNRPFKIPKKSAASNKKSISSKEQKLSHGKKGTPEKSSNNKKFPPKVNATKKDDTSEASTKTTKEKKSNSSLDKTDKNIVVKPREIPRGMSLPRDVSNIPDIYTTKTGPSLSEEESDEPDDESGGFNAADVVASVTGEFSRGDENNSSKEDAGKDEEKGSGKKKKKDGNISGECNDADKEEINEAPNEEDEESRKAVEDLLVASGGCMYES